MNVKSYVWPRLLGLVFILGSVTNTARADVILDPMDDTSHFSSAFGTGTTVTASGGSVVLSKTNAASVDSGIVWSDVGGANIDISLSTVTVTPTAGFTQDYTNFTALYFDSSGSFINPVAVVASDTNTSDPYSFDVAAAAPLNAASYALQIRILPFGSADASYSFDSIQAASASASVPEPGSMALIATGLGSLGLFRYRRRQSRNPNVSA